MWWLTYSAILILLLLQQHVCAMDPFDPYEQNSSCTSSMSTCAFELRTTASMTMFYKNLFRVIATEDGTLQNYQNPNQTFSMTDILTADGYPKLVCSILSCSLLLRQLRSLSFRFTFSIILCRVLYCMFIKVKQCVYVFIMIFQLNHLVCTFTAFDKWAHLEVMVSDV
jgi:hypothetical protein